MTKRTHQIHEVLALSDLPSFTTPVLQEVHAAAKEDLRLAEEEGRDQDAFWARTVCREVYSILQGRGVTLK